MSILAFRPMYYIRMYLVCVLFLGVGVLVALWMPPNLLPKAIGKDLRPDRLVAAPSKSKIEGNIVLLPIACEGAQLNSQGGTCADDLATLDLLISCYRRHHQGNPVGTNEEITAVLIGHNPQGLAYLPSSGDFLDIHDQLVDRWGTPYFFHALASDHMEIRSAGPDRVWWSVDDLIHRPGD